MAELAEKNSNIGKAYAVLRELSEDEKVRRIAEAREKARRDKVAELDFATQKGISLGREEGREEGINLGREKGLSEGREEAARRMKADGIDFALIAKYTNLTEEIIEKL
jgi:predicted transposase/invertase (TIGR01784 family)